MAQEERVREEAELLRKIYKTEQLNIFYEQPACRTNNARESCRKKKGWITPQEISVLSGNPVSYEKNMLGKLAEAGRIARVELHFPKYPSDGFGDNSITYFLRPDLFHKIQQEERKPENIAIQEARKQENSRPKYADRNYAHPIISTVRWKLHTEGKEFFGIPGAIRY